MAAIVQDQAATFTIPGPRPIPGLGRTGNLLQFARDPIGILSNLFRTYGSIAALVEGGKTRIISPYPDCPGSVFVYGAELNRKVITDSESYQKSALGGVNSSMTRRQEVMWNWGTGLFNVNGDTHRQHRRLLMPAFHKKQIEAYRDDMVAITQQVLDGWETGQQRDIQSEMTYLSLYIAGKTLFGEDILHSKSSVGLTLQQMVKGLLQPSLILFSYDLPGLPYRRLLDISERGDREIREVIAAKRAHGNDDSDVLSMLLNAQDEDGTTLTDDEVIGHAGIIFMAGHETSANALTWTLLLLSQHAEIAAALQDELSSVLNGAAPTVEQLASLPLLERVVKESMRVLPPVPLNHRIIAEPTELGGYLLPAHSEVFVSIYHTHHDPELYPQPDKFDPDRWLTINPSPFEYSPFSAGPRMCIGAPFAMMEIKLVLAMLLQRYRLEFIPGTRLDRRARITMAPRQGLPMKVFAQDRQFNRGVGGLRGNVSEMVEWPE
ncbi:MAG: cytochrome P450 [Chloroflexota bacterium]